MSYKISIIVPIFNQEKYLNKSIESIINQSFGFKNIELILVDDCSSDNSKGIIEEFASRYDNIVPVFLEKNSGGAAIPKNRGLDLASSEYIMFFDPDDYLMDDICEVLYDKISSKDFDFVSANAIVIKNGGIYIDLSFEDKREVICPEMNIGDFKKFRCVASLFKKNFLFKNDIKFLNSKVDEDTFFAHKAFFSAKKICYLDDYYGYVYFIRDNNSITHTHTKEVLLSGIYSYSCIKKNLIKKGVSFQYDPFLNILYTSLGAYWDCTKKDEITVFERILDYKNEAVFPVNLPIQYKVADLLLKRKQYQLLYYYHKFFLWLSKRKIVQKRFNPREELDSNSPVYNKVLFLKDWE